MVLKKEEKRDGGRTRPAGIPSAILEWNVQEEKRQVQKFDREVKILKSPFWSELPKHERRHSCQTSGLHRTLEEM